MTSTKRAAALALSAAAAAALGFTGPALAQDCAAIQDNADRLACYDCATLADDQARLACFDKQQARPQASAEPEPAPAEGPRRAPPPRAASPQPYTPPPPTQAQLVAAFGAKQMPDEYRPAYLPPQELEQITATVTDIKFGPYNKAIITLDNGQVWKKSSSNRIHYTMKQAPFDVVIESGIFGSFNLGRPDGHVTIGVRRVR